MATALPTEATSDQAEVFIRAVQAVEPSLQQLAPADALPEDPSGLNTLLECLGRPGRPPLLRHRTESAIGPQELYYRLYPEGLLDDQPVQQLTVVELVCRMRPEGRGNWVVLKFTQGPAGWKLHPVPQLMQG